MTDERLVLHVPADDGLIDLAARRRVRDLAEENAELKAEVLRLQARIAEHDHRVIDGAVTPHSRERCRFHLHVVVDEETPTCECADCGTRLDPHQVLLEFAKKERQFRSWSDHYRSEKHKLEGEVEALKVERDKVRAGLRRDAQAKRITELEKRAKDLWFQASELQRQNESLTAQLSAAGKKPRRKLRMVGQIGDEP